MSTAAVTPQVVDLTDAARIVARQQLTDPGFYKLVRPGLLDGAIQAVDQHVDQLRVGGQVLPLTDPRAAQALAEHQQSWVGVQPANPFLGSLMANTTPQGGDGA